MKVVRDFLQSLSDEGIRFFVVLQDGPFDLGVDEAVLYLSDRDAFEAEHERKLREEEDRY
jgi:hypothetical protein